MPTPNDYLADRENTPQVVYVEDSSDWINTYHFPDLVRNGLGLSVGWYDEADNGFLLFAKEDRLKDAQQYLKTSKIDPDNPSSQKLDELAAFLDPDRLRGRVLVFDDNTPGDLNGSVVIEAVIRASRFLPQEEKPWIVSMMCSSPDRIEKKPKRLDEWNSNGVELLFKQHYPLFAFWMGQKLKRKDLRFRDWMKETFNIDYANRTEEIYSRKLDTVNERLLSITDDIRLPSFAKKQIGILNWIDDKAIVKVTKGKLLVHNPSEDEITPLLNQWQKQYMPGGKEGGHRRRSERE